MSAGGECKSWAACERGDYEAALAEIARLTDLLGECGEALHAACGYIEWSDEAQPFEAIVQRPEVQDAMAKRRFWRECQ